MINNADNLPAAVASLQPCDGPHPAYRSHAETFAVLMHVRKRLMDQFGINITPEWEMRVVNGEHDIPFPEREDGSLQASPHDPATCWWCLNPQTETEVAHMRENAGVQ